jgi:hypothetical protein
MTGDNSDFQLSHVCKLAKFKKLILGQVLLSPCQLVVFKAHHQQKNKLAVVHELDTGLEKGIMKTEEYSLLVCNAM